MVMVIEGNLTFEFEEGWLAVKYDEWAFYRNQFQKICGGSNGVDILAVSPGRECTYLIEIKDYRVFPRKKAIDLADEVASKVRDTLAGLVAARVNANDHDEKDFARNSLKTEKLRVVVHLESPNQTKKLFQNTVIEPLDVKQKLKKLLKAVDPHPLVGNRAFINDRGYLQVTE